MKSENWILVILQKQLGKGFYKQANIDCVLFICSPCKKFLSDRNKKGRQLEIHFWNETLSDFCMSFIDAPAFSSRRLLGDNLCEIVASHSWEFWALFSRKDS